jgi:RimJ/RimL family protein N-acetyltransferase
MATQQTGVERGDVLETERLRLERWHDAHFERFARFMRNPDVIRYIRSQPLDREQAMEQHERSLEEWELFGFGKRAVVDAETGTWLGFVELCLVGPGKGSRDDDVEIGYFIEPSRWREGIATEAAFALRDEAFGRCCLGELIGRCRVENVASSRVLAKIGFQFLRLFELQDGIVVEIHRLQRDDWVPPDRGRGHQGRDGAVLHGTEYREIG